MSTSLRADRIRRICTDALLVACAMMLSYVEVLLPLQLLVPLPGFKLGLANTVTVLAFVLVSRRDAAVILSLRILLMSLLFGTVTSFFFSAMGGLLSFLALLLAERLLRGCSFLGVSVLSAAAHNLGQLLAACCFFGSGILLSYLPVLLLAAALCGSLTGILLNLSVPTLKKSIRRQAP